MAGRIGVHKVVIHGLNSEIRLFVSGTSSTVFLAIVPRIMIWGDLNVGALSVLLSPLGTCTNNNVLRWRLSENKKLFFAVTRL